MTTETKPKIDDRVFDVHGVCEWLKISRTTLWAQVKDGTFPQPFRVGRGQRSLRWRTSVVEAWIAEQEQSK